MRVMEYEQLPVPGWRPKVYKIQIKQYGLRKVVRVRTKQNGDIRQK